MVAHFVVAPKRVVIRNKIVVVHQALQTLVGLRPNTRLSDPYWSTSEHPTIQILIGLHLKHINVVIRNEAVVVHQALQTLVGLRPNT